MATERKTCFVIMPFSKTTNDHTEDYWTNFFDKILKPYIEGAGVYEAIRSMALRGDLVEQIIKNLITSPVVVADLTDRNPNVYWELGIRQSFRHGTITIIEEGNSLPFDVSGKGTLHYCPIDPFKMENFKKELQHAVNDCLTNPDTPDSRVLQAVTGRGSLFEIFRRDEAIRRLDALLSEISYNKRLVAAHQTMGDVMSRQNLPITPFRTMAVELLVVNRYLDEDESFFNQAEAYLFLMDFFNAISVRGNDSYSVKDASRQPQEVPSIIEKFEASIVRVREKLVNQV